MRQFYILKRLPTTAAGHKNPHAMIRALLRRALSVPHLLALP